MATKNELIKLIVTELIRVQNEPYQVSDPHENGGFNFPPDLHLGDGRFIRITPPALVAANSFAEMLMINDKVLRASFTTKEFEKIVKEHLALVLAELDLEKSEDVLVREVGSLFPVGFLERIAAHKRKATLVLGCHLIRKDQVYPLKIGPVEFIARHSWLSTMKHEKKLSSITYRRILKKWAGNKISVRKTAIDSIYEDSILNSIGGYPIVCCVRTSGLGFEFKQQKGVLAARIAMMAVSLIWERPSKTLNVMGLLYDGPSQNRHICLIGENGYAGGGASRHNFAFGQYFDGDFAETFKPYEQQFSQIGIALNYWVNPDEPNERPNLTDALLLSLIWYTEACREQSDQIATTKFAASMDALAKGKGAFAITRLVNKRFGLDDAQALFKDGRSAKQAIDLIYNESRSRLIHGNSSDYGFDWIDRRNTAEVLGRLCILEVCHWMAERPEVDSLDELMI